MNAHSGMIEGKWNPISNLTFAEACAAASVLRAYLVDEALNALDGAARLARSHPLADVTDCFCDGIALTLSMPPADRPAAVERLYSNCRLAAGAR